MKPGAKLYSAVSDAVVVVVKATGDGVVHCGGHPMSEEPVADKVAAVATGDDLQLGKRYEDSELGVQLLCVKPGAGPLSFGERTLSTAPAKQLPASD